MNFLVFKSPFLIDNLLASTSISLFTLYSSSLNVQSEFCRCIFSKSLNLSLLFTSPLPINLKMSLSPSVLSNIPVILSIDLIVTIVSLSPFLFKIKLPSTFPFCKLTFKTVSSFLIFFQLSILLK